MATVVIMPRQGQSVESCIITAFNKKVGDMVEKGETLFSYETDKSSFDEPAPESGKLLAIFREEGDDVPCLENVCVIGQDGEDISAFVPKEEETAAVAPAEVPAVAPAAQAATPVAEPTATAVATDIRAISPRARLLAEKTHADLLKAVPTGPNGRIIERDVQRLVDLGLTVSPAAKEGYSVAMEGSGINGKVVLGDLNAPAVAEAPVAAEAASATPVAAYEDVKLPNIRKVIAKSMHDSLANMAQLTLNASFDATKLMAFRASLKAGAEKMGLGNITLNDMVLFAVSRVLLNHKTLNAHYLDDTMRYFNTVNLGVAVDTERGLMVPTVFGAEKMSLNELSKAAKTVITAAQSGTINPDLLKGGTFTVTNLGSLGIESFTPVINPPQTGILGVCNITKRIKEVNGEDVTYPAMGLSLTFDHRALDGAPAAKFLKELCFALENFDLLLTK
ncbi:MAG: 2-oxo acid dehydrogenase subunit E2 [Clostridia bacterium]|nr:2-oxo acid dehydrogenase subunit E2 [Clostridia bacterium]